MRCDQKVPVLNLKGTYSYPVVYDRRHSWVDRTSYMYSEGLGFKSQSWDKLSYWRLFLGVLYKYRAASQIRPRPLASTSFPVYFSPIILPLDAILYALLTSSSNEALVKTSLFWGARWAHESGYNDLNPIPIYWTTKHAPFYDSTCVCACAFVRVKRLNQWSDWLWTQWPGFDKVRTQIHL
jgi:hypothetical protein